MKQLAGNKYKFWCKCPDCGSEWTVYTQTFSQWFNHRSLHLCDEKMGLSA
jgi:hypothetical protein